MDPTLTVAMQFQQLLRPKSTALALENECKDAVKVYTVPVLDCGCLLRHPTIYIYIHTYTHKYLYILLCIMRWSHNLLDMVFQQRQSYMNLTSTKKAIRPSIILLISTFF